MATALVRGMLGAGLARAGDIVASDPLEAARTSLAAETGISVFDANPPVVERSDVLVLAVKPQTMSTALAQLRPTLHDGHLVISVAAGVSIAALCEGLAAGTTDHSRHAQYARSPGRRGLRLRDRARGVG